MINTDRQIYIGVVEDRQDHLKLGRCKVRVAGLHTHDKEVLPTEDLPWAMILHPLTGGTRVAGLPPVEGSTVVVMFADWPRNQQPIVMGILGGIPQGDPVSVNVFEPQPLFKDYLTPEGRPTPTTRDEVNGVGPAE